MKNMENNNKKKDLDINIIQSKKGSMKTQTKIIKKERIEQNQTWRKNRGT